jgi:hypothetical protein
LGAKELLIISVRRNDKRSLSKADRSYSRLFKLISELLEDALTKSEMHRTFARRTDFGFPWFAL